MAPHQERVVNEKKELDEKLQRLNLFLGSQTFIDLAEDERERLYRQQRLMVELSAVLGERITAFR